MIWSGPVTPIICDTHIPIFFQDAPSRLSTLARKTFDQGISNGQLAMADISLWEIAMLFGRGRLNVPAEMTSLEYIDDLITAYRIRVLPISASIAIAAQAPLFKHGDPADRLIAATALVHKAPLLTRDKQLRCITELETPW